MINCDKPNEELEDTSLSELDMIIPPLRTFTKRVKLTKVENPIIIDLSDNFYDDYVSLNNIDIFAEPIKVKRKKIRFKKVIYQPKIDLGIDLDDL